MSQLSVEELFEVLIECAGEGEGAAPLSADTLDTPFEELGYDSLALMEAAARIKQRTGLVISDEQVGEVETPRQMLDLINDVVEVR